MPPSNVDVAMAPEVEVHFDHVQLYARLPDPSLSWLKFSGSIVAVFPASPPEPKWEMALGEGGDVAGVLWRACGLNGVLGTP